MKKRDSMECKNKFLWVVVCLVLIFGLAGNTHAKSVYAITKHWQSTIQIYDIQGDQLEYQEGIEPDTTGAVGLACDTDSETLFTTHDEIDGIGIIDIRTLEEIDFLTDDVDEFAGIVENEEKELDLRIISCYNKIILLSEKIMLGIMETL